MLTLAPKTDLQQTINLFTWEELQRKINEINQNLGAGEKPYRLPDVEELARAMATIPEAFVDGDGREQTFLGFYNSNDYWAQNQAHVGRLSVIGSAIGKSYGAGQGARFRAKLFQDK